MTRLLWPAVAALLIFAIGAPCLTFYLLMKDYWAELALLREKLSQCQLRATDSSIPASLSTAPSWQDIHRQADTAPRLPDPLPLVSSDSLATPAEKTSSATDPAPKDKRPESEEGSHIPSQVKSHALQSRRLFKKDYIADSPDISSLSAFRRPSNHTKDTKEETKISDYPKPKRAKQQENIYISKDYVEKVEMRLLDLSQRIVACRKCLTNPWTKESNCGIGQNWKEFRRKEKTLKKEIKDQKKRRRKNSKMKEKSNDNEITSAERNRPALSADSPEVATSPDAELSSFYEWHPYDSPPSDTHNMRENHRVSTDFRRGFNQKISRMDEALMQFTDTQAAFCKELRDNLGARLEKRGLELEALSEQIASLVRTTTAQVSMIEKQTSDQVYAGQTAIEKNLENLQVLRDDQIRSIQDFYKRLILPGLVTVTALLGDQASSITNMGVDLITKVEMLQDLYLTFATKQGDSLVKLSEEVDMFASKHGNLIMRSKDHARRLHISTEKFIRELQTRMNNVVKELVLVRIQSQNLISVDEDAFRDITSSLNETSEVVESLSQNLQQKISVAKEQEGDFSKSFSQEMDIINSRIESGISQGLMNNHGAVAQIGELDLESRVFTERAQAAWNELYLNQETELRKDADMLANNLRSHNHHTQNILTGLQGTASTHEQVLEQHRTDFETFIRNRQDALDMQCSSISDWALLMSSELRRRDEDLHRFLSEELHFSPVSMYQSNDYHDFLGPRLPDGTLLYNTSSSSDSSSRFEGRQSSNVTSHWEGKASETLDLSLAIQRNSNQSSYDRPRGITVLSSNDSLPESSLLKPSISQKDQPDVEIKEFESKEQSDGSTVLPDITPTFTRQAYNEGQKTSAGLSQDSRNVDATFTAESPLTSGADDSLPNDIKVNEEEAFDNSIIQNDESHSSSSESKVQCRSNLINIDDKDWNSINDQDFAKLRDILIATRKSILSFRKDLEVSQDLTELKKTIRQPRTEKANDPDMNSKQGFFSLDLSKEPVHSDKWSNNINTNYTTTTNMSLDVYNKQADISPRPLNIINKSLRIIKSTYDVKNVTASESDKQRIPNYGGRNYKIINSTARTSRHTRRTMRRRKNGD